MTEEMQRSYWRWRSHQGWTLLVHWSCAPVAAAIAGLAAIHIDVEYPGLSQTSRWFFAGCVGCLVVGSVAIHECGHLLMARWLRLEPACMILRGCSGRTILARPAPSPAKEALVALAGPAATLALAVVARDIALQLPPGPLQMIGRATMLLNGALVFASVLPSYPLDGGLAVRAWRWHVTGDRDLATHDARRVGQVIGVSLLLLGLIAHRAQIGWLVASAGLATLIGPATARLTKTQVPAVSS